MSKSDNPPIYVATGEFLAELRELGYHDNIELDDLIDFIEEDPSYIEHMRPAVLCIDEMNFLSRTVAQWYYNRRFPT